ncbi:hypothetical protein BOX15_Mlig018456g2 [Macrostomum lignano]|uniref:Uncharacterized protein n=1 Tax=Macrostomum lignano TaxID=282301 RepID=A0A267G397_9PLAT|nr:hypothetical protein BOX15_Mlig018456g2 [Macrostomum lignano]
MEASAQECTKDLYSTAAELARQFEQIICRMRHQQQEDPQQQLRTPPAQLQQHKRRGRRPDPSGEAQKCMPNIKKKAQDNSDAQQHQQPQTVHQDDLVQQGWQHLLQCKGDCVHQRKQKMPQHQDKEVHQRKQKMPQHQDEEVHQRKQKMPQHQDEEVHQRKQKMPQHQDKEVHQQKQMPQHQDEEVHQRKQKMPQHQDEEVHKRKQKMPQQQEAQRSACRWPSNAATGGGATASRLQRAQRAAAGPAAGGLDDDCGSLMVQPEHPRGPSQRGC